MKLRNSVTGEWEIPPCKNCAGRGYILSYDPNLGWSDDKTWAYVPETGHSVRQCPCQENVWVKPPKQEWDDIWMNLAIAISSRSTCNIPDRNIGCVITSWDNTKVLAMGYNGSAKGDDNSCEYDGRDDVKVGSSRCTCVHAEMNAMTKLDTSNPVAKRLYVTLSPCRLCYKLIVNAGIDELIYKTEHYVDVLRELERLGTKTRQYEDNRS
jgi:dCMP deaminase